MRSLKESRFQPRKFFVSITAGLAVVAILAYLIFGTFYKEVDAQFASLYSSTCLGGWKNSDLATGVPEIYGRGGVLYDETNSASVDGVLTQLFCGGFKGEIPETVERTKVELHFSWEMRSGQKQKEDLDSKGTPTVSEPVPTTVETESETITASSAEESKVDNLESVPAEPAASSETEETPPNSLDDEPVPLSWLKTIIPFAYAQAETGEVQTTPAAPVVESPALFPENTPNPDIASEPATTSLATSTPDAEMESSIASATTSTSGDEHPEPVAGQYDENKDENNAIFEVLYTMDSVEWHSLGFVSRINNDITFELPTSLFASVKDFDKLQVSLKMVERLENTPKIYLDAMWLEVSYIDNGVDPLPPPGTVSGDLILSKTTLADTELVTAFRNVALDSISNILVAQASTTGSPERDYAATTSLAELAPASTASASTSDFTADISLEVLTSLRNTPGVLLEIWLHNKVDNNWMRVADNSIVSTVPKVRIIEGDVFWLGVDGASLWRFDPTVQAYESNSMSAGESLMIYFRNSAGEKKQVVLDKDTNTLELKTNTEWYGEIF